MRPWFLAGLIVFAAAGSHGQTKPAAADGDESRLSQPAVLRVNLPHAPLSAWDRIRVATTGQVPPPLDDASWQREIATHAASITQDTVLYRVLADVDSPVRDTTWFQRVGRAADRLTTFRQQVKVSVVPGTCLIEVRVEAGTTAKESGIIAEAIVDSYLQVIQVSRKSRLQNQTIQLSTLKMRYQLQLNEVATNLRDVSHRAPTTEPSDEAFRSQAIESWHQENERLGKKLVALSEALEEISSEIDDESSAPVIWWEKPR